MDLLRNTEGVNIRTIKTKEFLRCMWKNPLCDLLINLSEQFQFKKSLNFNTNHSRTSSISIPNETSQHKFIPILNPINTLDDIAEKSIIIKRQESSKGKKEEKN